MRDNPYLDMPRPDPWRDVPAYRERRIWPIRSMWDFPPPTDSGVTCVDCQLRELDECCTWRPCPRLPKAQPKRSLLQRLLRRNRHVR